jgi:hypothetical protein
MVEGVFRDIFKEEKPVKIRSDKGSAFFNRTSKTFFDDNNVLHSVTRNEVKANYAERFIKTFKNKLSRFFLDKQKLRYLDVLQDLVDGYNNTYHETIDTTPLKATSETITDRLWEDQYVYPFWDELQKRRKMNKKNKKKQPFRNKTGQQVIISQRAI